MRITPEQHVAVNWLRSVVRHSAKPWPAHEYGTTLLKMICVCEPASVISDGPNVDCPQHGELTA